MADLNAHQHLVPADTQAKLYEAEMLLETKKSQLVRVEQDIKDITNIALKEKERQRHMLTLDIEAAKKQITALQAHRVNNNDEIIDV